MGRNECRRSTGQAGSPPKRRPPLTHRPERVTGRKTMYGAPRLSMCQVGGEGDNRTDRITAAAADIHATHRMRWAAGPAYGV